MFQKPLLSQNNRFRLVLQPVANPLQHRHTHRHIQAHILNTYRHSLPIQSVCMQILLQILSCYTFAGVYLHRLQVHLLLTRHLLRNHNISCCSDDLERTINKSFTGLIWIRHVTTNCAVTHQKQVTRCSPRVPVFSRGS